MRLTPDFFARETLIVARDLLGQRLVRLVEGRRVAGRIVEVEAYIGQDDQASHARCGPTARNAAMFGPPGHAYVYLIYGMYHCLNVVTEREGYPAAILLRALQPLEGLDVMRELRDGRPERELANGPGKLCQALYVDRRFDGVDMCRPESLLFIEQDAGILEENVATGPRIGVRGDEAALTAAWRFYVRDHDCLSR